MSPKKMDQVFPGDQKPKSDEKLIDLIANVLRAEYGNSTSAIKFLARDAGVEPRTAKNWYEGRNLLSFAHLIPLAHRSEMLRKLIVQLLEPAQQNHANLDRQTPMENDRPMPPAPPNGSKNVLLNVPLKLSEVRLNDRQLWIMEELCRKNDLIAEDVARVWKVGLKTAQRDIAGLMAHGLIDRIGSKKSGRYVPNLAKSQPK